MTEASASLKVESPESPESPESLESLVGQVALLEALLFLEVRSLFLAYPSSAVQGNPHST